MPATPFTAACALPPLLRAALLYTACHTPVSDWVVLLLRTIPLPFTWTADPLPTSYLPPTFVLVRVPRCIRCDTCCAVCQVRRTRCGILPLCYLRDATRACGLPASTVCHSPATALLTTCNDVTYAATTRVYTWLPFAHARLPARVHRAAGSRALPFLQTPGALVRTRSCLYAARRIVGVLVNRDE